MNIDPTQYSLHDSDINAIELDTVSQTLTLYLEINLAIEVTYREVNNIDDMRTSRLIFRGVSAITPPLPLFADGGDDPTATYGDIYDIDWEATTPSQAVLLVEINYGFKGPQDVIKSTITYQSVEWQIDPPAPPADRPFQPTEINAAAWEQFEQSLAAEEQAGHVVQLDIQVVNLPNADQRPLVLGARYSVDGAPFYHAFQYHNGATYDLSEASQPELLQALRNTIHAALGDAWAAARVVAEIHEDDHGRLYGRVTPQPGQPEQGFMVDYQLFFIARELRTRAARPWVRAEFSLAPDAALTIQTTAADGVTASEQAAP